MRTLFVALALLAAIPAYSDEPLVPIKLTCTADPSDQMENIFCNGMQKAFSKLNYARSNKPGDTIYFDFGFTPMQQGDSVLFVGMHISYYDARFKGLHLAVYSGSLVFTRPEGVAVAPDNKEEETQFDTLMTNIIVVTKEWYDFAQPILQNLKTTPVKRKELYASVGL